MLRWTRKPSLASQRKPRGTAFKHDKRGYKRRHRIGNMFGRFEDRRGIVTCYDRCPVVFLSTIALAVTIISWL
jgi:transposase